DSSLSFTGSLSAEKVARSSHIPVSHDTLLTLFHHTDIESVVFPFVDLDDFSFHKGHTYGTLICDLQSKTPLGLLLGCLSETVTTWLKKLPFIELVSRDANKYH
ncbi:hypothetical protein J7E66_27420, partial [Bacillus sp. ISL-7]|nr:hypothetical protein [Bacillus sp. ISL-7]